MLARSDNWEWKRVHLQGAGRVHEVCGAGCRAGAERSAGRAQDAGVKEECS